MEYAVRGENGKGSNSRASELLRGVAGGATPPPPPPPPPPLVLVEVEAVVDDGVTSMAHARKASSFPGTHSKSFKEEGEVGGGEEKKCVVPGRYHG